MKKLVWKLVLPLTVLSFMLFTQSWHVFVADGPDVYMRGFPLICESPGFHTSMSKQLFVAEFLGNLSVYFLFWFLVVFLFNRFVLKIKVRKFVYRFLIFLSILILALYASMLTLGDVEFKFTRDFDIEVKSTSITFLGL
ncbi:hypothetical protein AAON49_03045 [Pseudotenacibaculum sp. MALMAid0570]|uniref:hypothetical protein n=1 Tax=Pseudotenacibaculum sp. MALMAid0570 TaxID=3143938 RepID=UPI0032E02F0B